MGRRHATAATRPWWAAGAQALPTARAVRNAETRTNGDDTLLGWHTAGRTPPRHRQPARTACRTAACCAGDDTAGAQCEPGAATRDRLATDWKPPRGHRPGAPPARLPDQGNRTPHRQPKHLRSWSHRSLRAPPSRSDSDRFGLLLGLAAVGGHYLLGISRTCKRWPPKIRTPVLGPKTTAQDSLSQSGAGGLVRSTETRHTLRACGAPAPG